MQTAKIFKTGLSQAVRLPKEFRMAGKELSIAKLGKGIVLQPMPQTWSMVFQELRSIRADNIVREDLPLQEREPLK